MYHVGNDKRALLSAELIYNGLIEGLKEKSFDELSVTEIAQRAGVGRATFYRNFDSPIDVLHMKCDACFEEVIQGYVDSFKRGENDRSSLLVYYFEYWIRHSELLEALSAVNRMDIFSECHFKHSGKITALLRPGTDITSEEYIYFMSVRTGLTIGILSAWIKTGKKKSADELVALLVKMLDESMADKVLL